ncbi:nitrous oxide-stimulated promoter family protein [Desulfomarina sp.]
MKKNIVLIGMPGSGKSTAGVILAKILGMRFLDTDILIQADQQRTLQDIVDQDGHMSLREIEEKVLLKINVKNHVIATGGSAAYSHTAMIHLQKDGIIVFLHANLNALKKRIKNYETRGLAKRRDQSLKDLFHERLTLYRRYADITIENSFISQERVCEQIISAIFGGQQQLPPRLEREYNTMQAMVEIYCRKHHQPGKNEICNECAELIKYARGKLEKCPFQEKKSTCGKCTIHCYKKDMKEKVVAIMRYSGPKMIRKHPVMAFQHFLDSKKPAPQLKK